MIANYNYINDCNNGPFSHGSLNIYFQNTNKGKKLCRFINGKSYQDPDEKSLKLYEDLSQYYNKSYTPSKHQIVSKEIKKRANATNSWYELVVAIKDGQNTIAQIGLGADYIGPSVYWAYNSGLCNEQIETFLMYTRVFGGHIIWPRWIGITNPNGKLNFVENFETINVCRGGEKGLYDRFDLTLFDLNEWYLGNTCYLNSVFNKNKFWLDLFEDFNGFTNFFNLSSFIQSGNEGIKNICDSYDNNFFNSLSTLTVYPPSIPLTNISYQRYSNSLSSLISTRNNDMLIPK